MPRAKYTIEQAKRLFEKKKYCEGGRKKPSPQGRCLECGKLMTLTTKGLVRKHYPKNGRLLSNSQIQAALEKGKHKK